MSKSLCEVGNFLEGLLQVRFDVIDMLDPNAQTDEIFCDARSDLFFVGELLMSGYSRGNDQLSVSNVPGQRYSLRVSDISKMTDHL